MIFFQELALLLAIYLAPAIAVYPRILLSSRTAPAIPFLSIAVVIPLQYLLALTGHFDHRSVVLVSSALVAIATGRMMLLLRKERGEPGEWPASHRQLLLFSLVLGLYWILRLGTTGFDTNDEIYSWNMWAIQHYLGERIDFYYTASPYPQLLPRLLAYAYMLLGSPELQIPVRISLALFPIALWGAVALAPADASPRNRLLSALLMLLLMVAIGKHFGNGLADPLMASSLVVAIFLHIQYAREPCRYRFLYLSIICAAVALFTKQAALLWALFSYPAIALTAIATRRLPREVLAAAALLFLAGLVWVLGPGSGFHGNQGVINASLQGRSALEQLEVVLERYLIQRPLIPLLLAGAALAVFRTRQYLDIFMFFLVPALILWLVFGAYTLRLGVHIVAVAALLIAATGYPLPETVKSRITGSAGGASRSLTILVLLSLAGLAADTASKAYRNIQEYQGGFSPYEGGRNTIAKYFGKDADFVFRELYDRPDLRLWVPSNYIEGIFHGHTPLVRPSYHGRPGRYSIEDVLREIDRYRPDYLFHSGRVGFGPASRQLLELAEKRCPELFEKVASPPNRLGYIVYRLKKDTRLIQNCRSRLGEENKQE